MKDSRAENFIVAPQKNRELDVICNLAWARKPTYFETQDTGFEPLTRLYLRGSVGYMLLAFRSSWHVACLSLR